MNPGQQATRYAPVVTSNSDGEIVPIESLSLQTSSPKFSRPRCCRSTSKKNTGSRTVLRQYSESISAVVKQRVYGCNQSPLEFLGSFFPLFDILSRYKWRWVLNDFISGIIVSMIHLPQAMAGAMTAVMKPQHGLFMTIIPVVIYAFLGSSPQNSNGGMPVTAALVGVSMARIREDYHPENYTIHNADQMLEMHFQIAGAVAFTAGIFQILMGLFKFGFLSSLLSTNVLDPFSVACCLQAICGQIPVMLGIKLFPYCGLYKHPWLVFNMFANLEGVNGFEAAISAFSASAILGFREFLQPVFFRKLKLIVPIEFVVFILVTAASYMFDFKGRFGVRTMGVVPDSFPSPKLPSMEYVPHVVLEGFINGFVSFGITLTGAKIIARKDGDKISPNQELIAVGSSNFFGSFFSCFVSAAPVGRAIINHSMGSKSQLSSIFGALFMSSLFLTAGQSLKYLPVCVISTNIVVTLIMTLKIFADLPNLWRNSRLDAGIWISTFLGCIFLDVRVGLILGIALSLFSVTYRTQRPKLRVLGRIRDSSGYLPIKYYKQAAEITGLKILQMQSSLHYANAEYLVKKAKSLTFANNLAPQFFPKNIIVAEKLEHRKRLSTSTGHIVSSLSTSTRRASPVFQPLTFKSNEQTTIKISSSFANIMETPKDISEFSTPAGKNGSVKKVDSLPLIFDFRDQIVHRVILDLSMVAFIDSVGVRALEQLANDLKKADVELLLSQNRGSLIQQIKKMHVLKTIPEKNIFLTLEDAVPEALRRNIATPASSPDMLKESPDDHFWPIPVVRVEGLPGTNSTNDMLELDDRD